MQNVAANPNAALAPAPAAAEPLVTTKLTDIIAPKVSTHGLSAEKREMVEAMNEMRSALARMSILLGAMDVLLVDLKMSRLGGNAEPLDALSGDLRNIGQCVMDANAYFGRMNDSLNQVDTSTFDAAQNQKFTQFKNVFVNVQRTFSALAPAPHAAQPAPQAAQPPGGAGAGGVNPFAPGGPAPAPAPVPEPVPGIGPAISITTTPQPVGTPNPFGANPFGANPSGV